MKRVHLLEIEDQPWLPASIRSAMTDYLQFVIRLGRPYAPVYDRLKNALQRAQAERVVDLCSGSGGPWPSLLPQMPEPLTVQLTDRYPNEKEFLRLQAVSGARLCFYSAPVDATAVPPELDGFRTLFSSFHHFAPDQARAILRDATETGQGIGIFEATQRSAPAVLAMLLTPLIVLLVTPFIRPFRWSRLLWTYLLPAVPLLVCFDGMVSCLRTYTPAELRALVNQLPPSAKLYHWEIGETPPKHGTLPVTYLLGYHTDTPAENKITP